MTKTYTAQEIREAAEGLLTASASIFYIGDSNHKTYDYGDIKSMLRQAADLMECEEKCVKKYECTVLKDEYFEY